MQLTKAKLAIITGAIMVFTGLRGRLGGGPDGAGTLTFDVICLIGGGALLLWGLHRNQRE